MPPLQREVRRSHTELRAVAWDKIAEAVKLITDGETPLLRRHLPSINRSGDEHGAKASFALTGMVQCGIRLSYREGLDHWLDPVLR
jgi:hypothetical protein